jgi:hypothetical protein
MDITKSAVYPYMIPNVSFLLFPVYKKAQIDNFFFLKNVVLFLSYTYTKTRSETICLNNGTTVPVANTTTTKQQ